MILIWLKVTPMVWYFLFGWWGFYSELFLYFEEHGFYMGTGVVFWCMELWCDEECKWIVCGFWVWLGG